MIQIKCNYLQHVITLQISLFFFNSTCQFLGFFIRISLIDPRWDISMLQLPLSGIEISHFKGIITIQKQRRRSKKKQVRTSHINMLRQVTTLYINIQKWDWYKKQKCKICAQCYTIITAWIILTNTAVCENCQELTVSINTASIGRMTFHGCLQKVQIHINQKQKRTNHRT